MTYTHVQRVRILYKTILKLHRGLPTEFQVIGTNYVQDEFKRHKQVNDRETEIFMKEWTNYAISLANQLGLKGPQIDSMKIGADLSQSELDQFRDDQIYQLYELMQESSKAKMNKENVKK